jgi:hypothetical protein
MAHSKLKYPIGLLSENIQESIIGGLGLDFYKYQEIATMNISTMSIQLCMHNTPGVIFYSKHRCISLAYEDED